MYYLIHAKIHRRKWLFRYPAYIEHHGDVVACDSFLVTVPCSFDLAKFPYDVNQCVFKARTFYLRNDVSARACFSTPNECKHAP